jgi:hypothetical protein
MLKNKNCSKSKNIAPQMLFFSDLKNKHRVNLQIEKWLNFCSSFIIQGQIGGWACLINQLKEPGFGIQLEQHLIHIQTGEAMNQLDLQLKIVPL